MVFGEAEPPQAPPAKGTIPCVNPDGFNMTPHDIVEGAGELACPGEGWPEAPARGRQAEPGAGQPAENV